MAIDSYSLFAKLLVTAALLVLGGGCVEKDAQAIGKLDAVWGRHGISPGRLQKPRAMAIDKNDQLYLIDKTARVQVFTTDGEYLRSWQTPAHYTGCPTGISIDKQGPVLVADTHYYRVLVYSPEGELLETIGGTLGSGPGEFALVTDAVEDSAGNLYVSEYGDFDRIQKFSPTINSSCSGAATAASPASSCARRTW